MEDFLRFLITPLLSHPDKLQITGSNAALTLKVDDTDVGRVIGKNGHVINAIRTLLHTYSSVRQLPFTNLTLDIYTSLVVLDNFVTD